MSEDKKYRRNRIDEIFSKHGDEILEFIEENGVLVENQFYLNSMVFKYENDYIEEKLLQLGLPILHDEDEYYYDSVIFCGYHNGSAKTKRNHFYFLYYRGHHNTYTLKDAENFAINVYSALL